MAHSHETPDLPIIGTSRKPNSTDLLNRDLNGLSDPGPTIKLRKAALKKEQVALRTQVNSDITVSYLRTRIGESSDESEWSLGSETDSNTASDVGSVSESAVACDEEVVKVQKGPWRLRSRRAVQLHPYKREREVYRRMVRGRKDE